jgi:hypothetical protein
MVGKTGKKFSAPCPRDETAARKCCPWSIFLLSEVTEVGNDLITKKVVDAIIKRNVESSTKFNQVRKAK